MDERTIDAIVEQVMERLAAKSGLQSGPVDADGLVSDDIRAGKVVLGVSARHAHLTEEHVGILFGKGTTLSVFRPLLQPGEYASNQQVTLVSPTGRCLGLVRILGPTRKASQVEVSLTDCYALGFKSPPPIRLSGDHRDSPGITLVGPAGSVTLPGGLIRANRHIHLHTSQAAAMGLKDKDFVDVRVDGDRPTVFLECQIRASDAFRAEFHLDTDDANATGVKSGTLARILLKR